MIINAEITLNDKVGTKTLICVSHVFCPEVAHGQPVIINARD